MKMLLRIVILSVIASAYFAKAVINLFLNYTPIIYKQITAVGDSLSEISRWNNTQNSYSECRSAKYASQYASTVHRSVATTAYLSTVVTYCCLVFIT
jgi:hypothetical protein